MSLAAKSLIGALAAVALAVSSAGAWEAPGQTSAAPGVQYLADRSLQFWREHGLMTCPNGYQLWQAPSLTIGTETAWGRGDGATCEAWVSDDLAEQVVEPYILWNAVRACTAVTHEIGHALGRPHSERGVMSVQEEPYLNAWAPPFCRAWARSRIREMYRGYGRSEKWINDVLRRTPS